MTPSPRRLRAAFLSAALLLAAGSSFGVSSNALAQSKTIDVPASRQLVASEIMGSPSQNGIDYSANAGSLAGLALLATIPALNVPRRGGVIEAQCTAGVTVVLDDQAGSVTPTILVLSGPAANGGQGGSLDLSGMPHTGRIRIYSSNSGCQMAARVW
jgi:hypothetical protein